jgi:hypothetical protein
MAEGPPRSSLLLSVLSVIAGYDDADQLYWETRRLLDERKRADWETVAWFSEVYRQREVTDSQIMSLMSITERLRQDSKVSEDAEVDFLAVLLNRVIDMDELYGEEIAFAILSKIFRALYERWQLRYARLIDEITVEPDLRELLRISLASYQIEELLHVTRNNLPS